MSFDEGPVPYAEITAEEQAAITRLFDAAVALPSDCAESPGGIVVELSGVIARELRRAVRHGADLRRRLYTPGDLTSAELDAIGFPTIEQILARGDASTVAVVQVMRDGAAQGAAAGLYATGYREALDEVLRRLGAVDSKSEDVACRLDKPELARTVAEKALHEARDAITITLASYVLALLPPKT